MDPTGEQDILGLQFSLLDPLLYGFSGRLRHLELHRALRLVLQHDGPRRHLVTVAHVSGQGLALEVSLA